MIVSASATDIGLRRKKNEDSLIAFECPLGKAWVLCDGMGGHLGGDVASALAVEIFRAELHSSTQPNLSLLLPQAVCVANNAVYTKGQTGPEIKGMGTTLVACVVQGRQLHYVHVGDSRLYLIREGEMRCLTNDHNKFAELLAKGLVGKDEIHTHPQRNYLTRAIGTLPEVQVDYNQLTLLAGDQLLLCSDGLNGELEDGEIQAIIASAEKPVSCCQQLVEAANKAGGRDNVSLHIIQIS